MTHIVFDDNESPHELDDEDLAFMKDIEEELAALDLQEAKVLAEMTAFNTHEYNISDLRNDLMDFRDPNGDLSDSEFQIEDLKAELNEWGKFVQDSKKNASDVGDPMAGMSADELLEKYKDVLDMIQDETIDCSPETLFLASRVLDQ